MSVCLVSLSMSPPNGFKASHNPKVAGSNPATYPIFRRRTGQASGLPLFVRSGYQPMLGLTSQLAAFRQTPGKPGHESAHGAKRG